MIALRSAVLFALVSCGAPAPATPAENEPTPASPVSRCDEIATRFLAAVSAGTGECASSQDCGCYNPVHGGLGCGGVTDATTIAQLSSLEAEFHAASCPWPHQCGPWACAPRCESGRCAQ